MAAVSGLHERAGVHGFVVAYPDGYENSWNTGDGWGASYENGIDDIAFVNAILTDMESSLSIDHSRIFTVGFSNGGKLVYRLACELSNRFAAIAVVASSLDEWDAKPSRPIPVLHIHGTHDQLSPFSGGYGIGPARTRKQMGVPTTIAKWLEWNGLENYPTAVKTEGQTTFLTYGSTTASADIVLCIIDGLGHQWPSGEVLLGLGPGVEDLSAKDLIMDFFLVHPLAKTIERLRIGS